MKYKNEAQKMFYKNPRLPCFEKFYTEKYGKAECGKILSRAAELTEKYYHIWENAPKGEKMHARGIIRLSVIYMALKEYHPDEAFEMARQPMLISCAKTGDVINKITASELGRGFIMKMAPVIAAKMFGEGNGFKQTMHERTKTCVRFDITKCPYCKYCSLLGVNELMPVYCETDVAAYSGMKDIRFDRTQTLGTGGEKCDFVFTRTDK